MVRLSEIAREENPDLPLLLLGHDMGSFAAQRYVIDHSHEIDGLILSGSGALEGLARTALPETAGSNLLNAAFEPARTPFDWLCRDQAIVDAFMADPLCSNGLHPDSLASFLGAAPRLSDPAALRKIRRDLPIYLFSGSEDPIGQQLPRASQTDLVATAMPGCATSLSISIRAVDTRCSTRSTDARSKLACSAGFPEHWKN